MRKLLLELLELSEKLMDLQKNIYGWESTEIESNSIQVRFYFSKGEYDGHRAIFFKKTHYYGVFGISFHTTPRFEFPCDVSDNIIYEYIDHTKDLISRLENEPEKRKEDLEKLRIKDLEIKLKIVTKELEKMGEPYVCLKQEKKL